MPGPVPKRSNQRHHQGAEYGDRIEMKKAPGRGPGKLPRVSPGWHPLMKDWFRSLKESGQSQFYEASDWQTARLLAEIMSQELNSDEPVKASMLAEFNRAAASLMTTEGERRRLRVELQAPQDGHDDGKVVSIMDRYREKLSE